MRDKTVRNIFIAFILNLFFSIFELVGGFLTNSVSIISDSLHDFCDAISVFITLVLEKVSRKKINKEYTFGYSRYSIFGALFTSGILFFGSLIVILRAIGRVINPARVNYNGMILLAVIGVIINLIATRITSHGHNLNEKAVSLHMLEDVLGWVCVLVGSIIIKYTNLYIIDPILSIFVSIFILIHVFTKLKEIFSILSEKKPDNIDIDIIKKKLLTIDSIKDIHHIHIWSLDGNNNYITLHVLINKKELDNIEKIKDNIRDILKEYKLLHSNIEIEIEKCNNIECNNFINIEHHH